MLKYLSGFSNELCLLINSNEGDENNDTLNALLKRYKDCFPLSKKQISGLLKSSKEKVSCSVNGCRSPCITSLSSMS